MVAQKFPREHPAEVALVLDCDACPDRVGEAECDGCIVAYLLDRPAGAIVFNAAEERALRALRDGGLLPAKEDDELTG
jgi:hypothetical protein